MIDLTSAGERSLGTLDSLSEFQFALRSAPIKADLVACLKNLKLSQKALSAVDDYLKSPDHFKSLPLSIWSPVTNNGAMKLDAPHFDRKISSTLSHPVIRDSDSRVFKLSIPNVPEIVLIERQRIKSINQFL